MSDSNGATIEPDEPIVEPLAREVDGDITEDIPFADAHAGELENEPDTQEGSPVEVELGEDGQGDLAPEDLPDAPQDPTVDNGPTDLRTEL